MKFYLACIEQKSKSEQFWKPTTFGLLDLAKIEIVTV